MEDESSARWARWKCGRGDRRAIKYILKANKQGEKISDNALSPTTVINSIGPIDLILDIDTAKRLEYNQQIFNFIDFQIAEKRKIIFYRSQWLKNSKVFRNSIIGSRTNSIRSSISLFSSAIMSNPIRNKWYKIFISEKNSSKILERARGNGIFSSSVFGLGGKCWRNISPKNSSNP